MTSKLKNKMEKTNNSIEVIADFLLDNDFVNYKDNMWKREDLIVKLSEELIYIGVIHDVLDEYKMTYAVKVANVDKFLKNSINETEQILKHIRGWVFRKWPSIEYEYEYVDK